MAGEVFGYIGTEQLLKLVPLVSHAQKGLHLTDDSYIYIEHVMAGLRMSDTPKLQAKTCSFFPLLLT